MTEEPAREDACRAAPRRVRPWPTTAWRLGVLFALYFVQGLPFGFQAMALPVYLREADTSLTVITLVGMLSLPWGLKVVWAPFVDRTAAHRLGRRRVWILPLQLALALLCLAASFARPDTDLAALLALVLGMNICTALMDIAVDGLAIDCLPREHLGYGNIAQVVGYKVGMITSGGLLLAYSDTLGWSGMFAIMAGLVALGFTLTLLFREPRGGGNGPDADGERDTPTTVRRVVALVIRALRTPAARWILIFIATYKTGEAMADVLFRPFLIDAGFSRGQIGVWVGFYGMSASIVGSTVGGILASRVGLLRAVGIAAALRVLPVIGEFVLTLVTPTADAVIAVTVAEHFFGGILTTAMFAFMMAQVDRRIGATHFTLFATVEVLGKSFSAWLSGALADATGYPLVYGVATALSVAFLALLVPLSRQADTGKLGRRIAT